MREGEGENWGAVQLWGSGLRGLVGAREGQKMGFPRVALQTETRRFWMGKGAWLVLGYSPLQALEFTVNLVHLWPI